MHIAVEITAVVKLNFIANCISFERRLAARACGVVCVTTHIRRTEIKTARDTLDRMVMILIVESFNLKYHHVFIHFYAFLAHLLPYQDQDC